MRGAERCDEIVRLIDEALGDVAPQPARADSMGVADQRPRSRGRS